MHCQSVASMIQCVSKPKVTRIEITMARATPGLLTYRRADGAEERIKLREDLTTLGRSDSCAVVIALPVISRLHARIELQNDRYVLFDAGSANGTFVNGTRIEHGHLLRTNDQIWLGAEIATLQFFDSEELLGTAPPLLDLTAYPPAVNALHSGISLTAQSSE